MTAAETLRDLRALATTLVARIDDALEGHADPDADLRHGKTPDAILRLIQRRGPMAPGAIAEALREAGRDVSDAAVYQACSRHARAGALRRVGGAYDLRDARIVRELAGGEA